MRRVIPIASTDSPESRVQFGSLDAISVMPFRVPQVDRGRQSARRGRRVGTSNETLPEALVAPRLASPPHRAAAP
ncbi:MAG TPA: hypothetical protein VF491_10410 [Vicinamibacterales bacterium]